MGDYVHKPDFLGPITEVGYCDDCISQNIRAKKQVHRIEEDNIYFCREHWGNYRIVMIRDGNEDPGTFFQLEKT